MSASGRTPITTDRVAPIIERAYYESLPFQWARETLFNGAEAGATKMEYHIEWQGVEKQGVYRRYIADNGESMNADKLRRYFSTFGGGGKPIGELYENFGIGSKTSLLPWNKAGLVVVCWHPEGDFMIWIDCDPKTGEYGLRRVTMYDEDDNPVGTDDVWTPDYYDDELGIDFATLKPDFIEKAGHGTLLLLCGNSLDQDTILGDPSRKEHKAGGLAKYLNTRLWDVETKLGTASTPCPAIHVEQFDRLTDWPTQKPTSTTSKANAGFRPRYIAGASYFVTEPVRKGPHTLQQGALTAPDSTRLEWYLRDGAQHDPGSWGPSGGYIAVRHANEVYNPRSNGATWRRFGIDEKEVRDRLWVIIDPPLANKARTKGVYPNATRSGVVMGSPTGPLAELPMTEWADFFAANLPDEIVAAIKAVTPPEEDPSESLKDRLKERFGKRWQLPTWMMRSQSKKRVVVGDGPERVRVQGSDEPWEHNGTKPITRRHRSRVVSAHVTTTGGEFAVPQNTDIGLPRIKWVNESDMDLNWHMATFSKPSKAEPTGVVRMNKDHYVIVEQIAYHQARMIRSDDAAMTEVAKLVRRTYGDSAAATVAHLESLSRFPDGPTPQDLDERLRSPESLTAALMGLVGEDYMIGPALGKIGKTRK